MTIDEKYMRFGAHGVYIARDSQETDSLHIIGFSPSRMSANTTKQGNTLRHETEHFIYQIQHPYHLRNRKILAAGITAVGGCIGAAIGLGTGIEMSRSLPLAAEIPIDIVTSLAAAGLSSAAAFASAYMGHVSIGPSEIQAERAESRRRFSLPDGVLQVEFA